MSNAANLTREEIESDGFALVERVFDEEAVVALVRFIEAEVIRSTRKGGVRNLLDFPEMRALADGATLRGLVDPLLGSGAKVVRGILFDKSGDANWKVPWHQDVTIAVSHRIELEGYGPWSVKSGVLHVQPPSAVLEDMLSVRIHLDDCPEENGALRVLAGSHKAGKLPAKLPEEYFQSGCEVICAVNRGAVLLMRPLLIHASSAAIAPAHRRVIHFDYAAAELPNGTYWAVDQA